MELACKQGLAYRRELACRLALERKLALQQLCELELGRRKQFLHKRLRLHFLNKHQLYCKLRFVYDRQVTKLGIDQMLSTHLGAHFVRSLLRCSHLAQHIHIDILLDHLHKQGLYHKLELEHDTVLEVQRQKQQPKRQSRQ